MVSSSRPRLTIDDHLRNKTPPLQGVPHRQEEQPDLQFLSQTRASSVPSKPGARRQASERKEHSGIILATGFDALEPTVDTRSTELLFASSTSNFVEAQNSPDDSSLVVSYQAHRHNSGNSSITSGSDPFLFFGSRQRLVSQNT